jgi:hypothetical protein
MYDLGLKQTEVQLTADSRTEIPLFLRLEGKSTPSGHRSRYLGDILSFGGLFGK